MKLSSTALLLLLVGAAVLIGVMLRRAANPGVPAPVSSSLTEHRACRLALAPAPGDKPSDAEIARLQGEITNAHDPRPQIENLGWAFVKKARLTFDNGYYKLAEQCAACLDATGPRSAEALLLRSHVLQSLHRFKEAESLARDLVSLRERPFDYGVLGDVLIDQGKIREGAAAYQKMVDLRPDLHSYARGAHVRWLTGDVIGAIQLMKLAAGSSSPNDPEAAGWAYTRLALYQLQQNELKQAVRSCDEALSLQPGYAPALFVRGRILLASDRSAEAIGDLEKAVSLNPLVEYQWTLSDALREAGNLDRATEVEAEINKLGVNEDPRTFSLYLIARRENVNLAVQLAEKELSIRQDIFTYDALAWALAAAGRTEEAQQHMRQAFSEGTRDARLFLHAGVIASLNHDERHAVEWLAKANTIRQMLLPGERAVLDQWRARIRTRG